ncbi:MAG TPA: type II CRISPR RNA-guided endonuclease Cas9, partial [Casimicrobium sp.]|nr:type II CRISPR RNA-guided endonuclease Cas9 [Casimicrobium sp.]
MSGNSAIPFEMKKLYRGLTREQIDALGPLTFGFDIGIASVGWAVLCGTRIVDLGVRAFDKAETADKGESLNLARRTARLMRRRLRRRAWRLRKVARALKRHGVIADSKLFLKQPGYVDSVWQLRKAGLDRLLTPAEWVRVVYHLCKHRGFHWTSRAEALQADDDAKSENGKVKQGLAGTAKLMKEKGYRTAAEMVLAEFPDAQRNKRGEYTKALSRVLLAQELSLLFARQRELGSIHATAELQSELLGNGDQKSGLFWAQKPALSGADLLKMLGRCTFEKTEPRAPKASFTAERHVWLTRLNNLRITIDGVTRPLIDVERSIATPLPYTRGEKFTYKDLRTALQNAGLSSEFRFAGLSYPSLRQREENKAKDPETETLTKLSAWHDLRLAFKRASLETLWQQLSTPALDGDPVWLDQIGWVLSVYKDDDEVERELRKLSLPGGEAGINVLLGVRFDKFHALSLKALRQIVPKMEEGMRFDEAVAAIPAYGHHSQPIARESERSKYLPPFYTHREKDGRLKFNDDLDVPRNPVVLRALNQARKVCNALIKVYGAPHAVNIEMARDLSRPLEERREVLAAQKEFRERNEKAREQFEETFGRKSTGATLEKWMLYREQM